MLRFTMLKMTILEKHHEHFSNRKYIHYHIQTYIFLPDTNSECLIRKFERNKFPWTWEIKHENSPGYWTYCEWEVKNFQNYPAKIELQKRSFWFDFARIVELPEKVQWTGLDQWKHSFLITPWNWTQICNRRRQHPENLLPIEEFLKLSDFWKYYFRSQFVFLAA